MIDREQLKYITNILELHNEGVDTTPIYNLLTALKDDDALKFYSTLLTFKPDLNIDYLLKVLYASNTYLERKDDLFDSFSNNQIAAKTSLVKALDSVQALDNNPNIVIWGSWYGSVLIPLLQNKAKNILCVDLDLHVAKVAKNYLFDNYDNLQFNVSDVFDYKKDYINTNLFINTSCEHMPPMKEWEWFKYSAMEADTVYPKGYGDTRPNRRKIWKDPKISNECYFAFQSNNMFGIEGHINCVSSIEEFKEQLPERAEVLYEEEVEDTRGTRYMLVGKFMPL